MGKRPASVFAYNLNGTDPDAKLNDNLIVSIRFIDGSIGSITYTSKGDTCLGKEYIEAFADRAALVIDNFKISKVFKQGRVRRFGSRAQDKGHYQELKQFIEAAAAAGPMPISWEEIYYSSLATLAIIEALEKNQPVQIE